MTAAPVARLTSSPHLRLYSKVIGPVFEKLESSFPNIGFYKCDVDEQEVRRRAGFRAVYCDFRFSGFADAFPDLAPAF